jgi:hypothetical protein
MVCNFGKEDSMTKYLAGYYESISAQEKAIYALAGSERALVVEIRSARGGLAILHDVNSLILGLTGGGSSQRLSASRVRPAIACLALGSLEP